MLNLKNARSKKGFTLMEMLIVVAIIAILVAIAIPTFTSQLNKVKIGADQANIRNAYALVQTSKLLGTDPKGTENYAPATDEKWYFMKDGTFEQSATAPANAYKTQTAAGSTNLLNIDTSTTYAKDNYIVATYTKSTTTWSIAISAS